MIATEQITKPDGEELVKAYKMNGSERLKEKIIQSFAPLVKHIVGRFNLTYSRTLSSEDLYQYGILGLLKALERYKTELDVPFKNYAYRRIHGEVVDALRREGVIGRDKYEKIRQLEEAISDLTGQLGNEPAPDDVCSRLNISVEEYYELLSTAQLTYMTSLNNKISDDEGTFVYRIDTLVDDKQLTPAEVVEKENLKENLKQIIHKLPEREKIILALYFFEELTLADIGRVLGVSEARISQILSKTLVKIRAELNS